MLILKYILCFKACLFFQNRRTLILVMAIVIYNNKKPKTYLMKNKKFRLDQSTETKTICIYNIVRF